MKKPAAPGQPAPPNPGFYGPQLGSPQNVEMGQHTNCPANYLRSGHARALEIIQARREFDTPDKKLRDRARFQGSGTMCFKNK